MNDWNCQETQLRKWKPRPPSPELRQRLFRAPRAATTAARLPEFWRWAVPALGCFLLVVSSLSTRMPQPGFAHLAATNCLPFSEAADSASYLEPRHYCAQNRVPLATFVLSFAPEQAGPELYSTRYTNALIQ